ncbi:MAG TPA: glycosyltransferase family 39 protein [Xanthobacteraceae bacterium]|nr:glycosyltransferase family 39 protein [Xanthobacteraceae bacterium]
MNAGEARLLRQTWLAVAALVVLRLVAAAVTPLSFDEAYYWTWSKHLAGGYYDHPPMVALVIRLGTLIAGDTQLGVRLVSVLLALPMSWAVYETAAMLFGGRRVAATSAVLLNVTLMMAVGTMIVTPDAPLMVASSFVLYALAKVLVTGRGIWWLAVGLAVGAALLSKYTALFFGPVILLWLVVVPKLRRWLLSPWPYVGGIVAFAVFAPVILWNAEHHWVSFLKQFGRARVDHLTLRYVAEILPTQIMFASPPVFVLGAMGLYAMATRRGGAFAARALLNAVIWIITLYFVWHSLHSRVEGNWLGLIYPAFAIAAAVAAHQVAWPERPRRLARVSLRWAAPVGIALFVLLVIQANTGLLSGYRRDATVRSIGVGWREVARQIEAARAQSGAACVLANDYGTTGWLMFYLPKGTCVLQYNERIRWVNAPAPSAAQLGGKLLLVDEDKPELQAMLMERFARVEKVGEATRRRGPLPIETYQLTLLAGAKGDALDNSPPPELSRNADPK